MDGSAAGSVVCQITEGISEGAAQEEHVDGGTGSAHVAVGVLTARTTAPIAVPAATPPTVMTPAAAEPEQAFWQAAGSYPSAPCEQATAQLTVVPMTTRPAITMPAGGNAMPTATAHTAG